MTLFHGLRRLAPVLISVAVLVPLAEVVAPASAGAATVTNRIFQAPATIDGTGRQDVTAAIVAFIRSVPDGNTVTFPRGAKYRIESTVTIGARHNLVVDGTGAQFFATTDGTAATPIGPAAVTWRWPRHRDQFAVYAGTNVTLRNLTVRGANPRAGLNDDAYVEALEAQSGIDVFDSVNTRIENCTISDTYGDFVYIGRGATGTVVTGCTMTRSGRQGITVSDAQNVMISRNNISYVRRTAIDLEPYVPEWAIHNVWITDNTFTMIRLLVVGAKGEGDVNEIVIANNKMVGEGIGVANNPLNSRRRDWFVIGNSSDRVFGSPHGAIWVARTDHVVVTGNYQQLQAKRPGGVTQMGAELPGSTAITMSGNRFPFVAYK